MNQNTFCEWSERARNFSSKEQIVVNLYFVFWFLFHLNIVSIEINGMCRHCSCATVIRITYYYYRFRQRQKNSQSQSSFFVVVVVDITDHIEVEIERRKCLQLTNKNKTISIYFRAIHSDSVEIYCATKQQKQDHKQTTNKQL